MNKKDTVYIYSVKLSNNENVTIYTQNLADVKRAINKLPECNESMIVAITKEECQGNSNK